MRKAQESNATAFHFGASVIRTANFVGRPRDSVEEPMFIGGYWKERQESRDAASSRIATFLESLRREQASLATWYRRARSRAAALRAPIQPDVATIASNLRVNRRDADNAPIPELGYRFSAWNGRTTSLSAHIGSFTPFVGNSIVLDFDADDALLTELEQQRLLEALVQAFDPDHAVVTNSALLDRVRAKEPWEAGWFTYSRNSGLQHHDCR